MWPGFISSMPIPGMDQTYDPFYNRAVWALKFVWWPRRSDLTGQWIWLCWAYRGTAVWTGPGDPVIEHRYHETVEHLIWQLKRG